MGSTKAIVLGFIVAILWIIFCNDYANIQNIIVGIRNGSLIVNPTLPSNGFEAIFAQLIGGTIFPIVNTVLGVELLLPQLIQIGIVFILAIPFSLWLIFEVLEDLGILLPAWSKVLIVIAVFLLIIVVGIYAVVSNAMQWMGM